MHYFTYFNRTDAELHGYWKACKVLLITEIALLLISHIYYIMTTYMMVKGMRYQKNLRILWVMCSIQYLFSIMDRVLQIGITLFDIEGSHPSLAFVYSSYMRAFCIHIGLLIYTDSFFVIFLKVWDSFLPFVAQPHVVPIP
ncbi:hypothetical protein OSTOST_20225 [Ostertagia ostertagi]